MALHIRPLTDEEQERLMHLSQSRTAAVRDVERARIILQSSQGQRVPAIARTLALCEPTVRLWIKRFNERGLAGLADAPHRCRPATYTREQVGLVVATALTDPQALGQPFACWTFARLAVYLQETQDLTMSRSRIHEVLQCEGLRWRTHETWFGQRVDPDFAVKRGQSSGSTPSPQRAAS
ncbi:MAG TPA: helix-turn-helix domain-containing protein [Ktedonobacterales bacterium]|jgi:transposase|nr:helix-turn-helix domain-containing protein [Ktedonobacterales bacterium]